MIYPLSSPLVELVIVQTRREAEAPSSTPLALFGGAPDALEDVVYAGETYTATGGAPPYTFDISSGSLPPGLTLSSGGVLSGTPTTVGTYSFTVRVTDDEGTVDTLADSVIIYAALSLSNAAPDANTSSSYTHTYAATGGIPPYSYEVLSGSLPTGLSLASDGVLSGTPTTGGTYSFTVRVTDSIANTADLAESVTITAVVTPADFPGLTGWFDATDASRIYEGSELATMTPVDADGDPVFALGTRAGALHPSYLSGPNAGSTRTYAANGLSGRDAVAFSSAISQLSAYYQSPGPSLRTVNAFIDADKFTVVWCGRISAVATNSSSPWENHYIVRGDTGYFGLHLRNNGGTITAIAYVWDGGAKTASVTITAAVGSLMTLAMRLNSGSLQIRVNGGSWVTTSSVGNLELLSDTFQAMWAVDRLRHLAVYDQALSDADITSIENYMVA